MPCSGFLAASRGYGVPGPGVVTSLRPPAWPDATDPPPAGARCSRCGGWSMVERGDAAPVRLALRVLRSGPAPGG